VPPSELGTSASEIGNAPRLTGGEFVVRGATSPEDVERVAALSGVIHGPGVAELTRALFLHHPKTELADLFFVEHVPSQQVVSTLCLIPWVLCMEGVGIRAGEMGIVGTLEPYRKRGLVRAQVKHFDRRLSERGCLVSHIQGIPYFYRQFGYEFALPLEGGLRLELRDIPEAEAQTCRLRRATLDDLLDLARLYGDAAGDLAIHSPRDETVWRYLLTHASGTDTGCERWLVDSQPARSVGYFAVPVCHFGDELVINQTSRLSFDAALAVLRHARELARERGRPGIRLNLPAGCTLMKLARQLGARDLGAYGWQVRVTDFERLLRVLAPVLERRLARSPFAGLTRSVRLGLYQETLRLGFEAGQLQEVDGAESTGAEAIRLPPPQFVQLVLGYCTREELETRHPDVRVVHADRMLIDVLFPPS